MEHYIDTGNYERLQNEHKDLVEQPDFDYTSASARLLGRDVAKIAVAGTHFRLLNILSKETDVNSDYRFVNDMILGEFDRGEKSEYAIILLRQLLLGIKDKRR